MGSYTGTVPTFLVGEIVDADKLLEITNFMTAATAAWTAYTPTWTASAGSPSIGNGTLAGRYRRLGKTVNFQILLTGGSTSNYGTAGAYWAIGLPPLGNTSGPFVWPARLIDGGVAEYTIIAANESSPSATGSVQFFRTSTTGRQLNNTGFTFGTGDSLWVAGTYELA